MFSTNHRYPYPFLANPKWTDWGGSDQPSTSLKLISIYHRNVLLSFLVMFAPVCPISIYLIGRPVDDSRRFGYTHPDTALALPTARATAAPMPAVLSSAMMASGVYRYERNRLSHEYFSPGPLRCAH